MTNQSKPGTLSEGLFSIEEIDRALFTLDDVNAAIGDCLQSNNTHGYDESHENRKVSYEELGIIFHNDTGVVFSHPDGVISITFAEAEMLLYKFFIDNPGELHRVQFLHEKLQQNGFNISQEQVNNLIKTINLKLGHKLFFSCGISQYSQIPVLHGLRIVFKKNGKTVTINKLLRTIEWQDNKIFIDDEDFFIKIYACLKHVTFDEGVDMSEEYAERVRKLKLPLEEKKGGRFSL